MHICINYYYYFIKNTGQNTKWDEDRIMFRLFILNKINNTELQIIFTVVSVFTKENFNPFSNLISPFGTGTHEIQWLFSIFLTHNWSPIYLLL